MSNVIEYLLRYKIGRPLATGGGTENTNGEVGPMFLQDLKDGWVPHGSPFYDKEGYLCQAMTMNK